MRIKKTFEKLETSGKKALIPFVTAGDPNYDLFLEILKVISKSGADIIELGMPFQILWQMDLLFKRLMNVRSKMVLT